MTLNIPKQQIFWLNSAGTLLPFQGGTNGLIVELPATAATTSGTTVQYSASASTLIALNTSRQYGFLRNFTDATLYLGFGRVPTATNFDAYLLQNEAYEITNTNLFTGNIQGIGSGAGTICLLEW